MKALAQSLVVASCAALLATPALAAPSVSTNWQPTWISPAQPVWGADGVLPLGMPARLRDVTLRQSLRTSLGGVRVRLVVSNEYGSEPLRLGAMALRKTAAGDGAAPPALAVRFQGRDGILVAAGGRAISDPVDLPVDAGDRLDVDLHLPESTALAGFHWDAQEHTEILRGDAAGRRRAAPLESVTTRAFVSELWVEAGLPPASVVAIGDSITDGNGSSLGRDQRWPDHLSRRLAPSGIAVLNAGIAGNRLLHGGWGESALARFERDVLSRPGVRAVVILLGTNDIGLPGSPFAPTEQPVSLDDLAGGFLQLAEQARSRHVRVIVGTVPPFEHALEGTPLEGHYSPAKDALRRALNDWIRSSRAFDAVVDFDAVLRDPGHPARLDPSLDSGDHLHPGDAGYERMAAAIDLDALLGGHVEEGAR